MTIFSILIIIFLCIIFGLGYRLGLSNTRTDGMLFIDEASLNPEKPDVYMQLWVEAAELKDKQYIHLLVDNVNSNRSQEKH